jgi:hypothetical protein
MARNSPTPAILRIALFSAAFAGFVFAMLLAGSPELHEWAHHHSDDSEHECLADALHSGACDHVTPAPLFTGIAFGPVEAAPAIRTHAAPSLFLSCRILEHAPPARG